MNARIVILATVLGGACLITSAWALPIATAPEGVAATQVRDDESNDIARQVIRGFEGRSSYRDRDHDRREGWGHRDYRENEHQPRRFHDDD